jgi:hypothetical protein
MSKKQQKYKFQIFLQNREMEFKNLKQKLKVSEK